MGGMVGGRIWGGSGGGSEGDGVVTSGVGDWRGECWAEKK